MKSKRKIYKGAAAFIQAAKLIHKRSETYACLAICEAKGLQDDTEEECFFCDMFGPGYELWTWGNQTRRLDYPQEYDAYRNERVLALLLCAAMWKSGER